MFTVKKFRRKKDMVLLKLYTEERENAISWKE